MRAATVTSLISRVKVLPFLASDAAFLCFMLAHLECPDMAERRVSGSGKPIIYPLLAQSQDKSLHDRILAVTFAASYRPVRVAMAIAGGGGFSLRPIPIKPAYGYRV